ncbi:MAG: EamA family transporter [Hyphomicrobiaceae bacterium]
MPLSAWLFSFASAILFALGLNVSRLAMNHISSALGSMISIPTACVLFWLSSPFTADFSGWRNDAALLFALTGLFYPAAITIITFEATRILGPNVTSALANLTPLYAVFAGILFLGETLHVPQYAGIALLMLGVTVLTTKRDMGGGNWPLWAIVLPLSASLLRGLGQPLLKVGFTWWNNPRVATLLCYASSATVVIIVGLLRKRATAARFTPKGVAWFMFVGVLNGLATWAGIEAVARGPVSLVVPVVASYPLFTLLIGLAMTPGTRVGWAQAAGVILSVAGVIVVLAA